MRLLLVSDEEDKYLWDYYRPGRLAGYDLILSAGDLKAEYLSFLVTMANRPLLYVPGNHDGRYAQNPPEGCDCIDGKLVTVNGLRILGLGGSALYNGGPNQYTEAQMARRIRRLALRLRRAGGVDLVLSHAPLRGYGDQDDPAHRGFEAFLPLVRRWHPTLWVHGHVHRRYDALGSRLHTVEGTTVLNAWGRCELELEPGKLLLPGNLR